MGDKDVTMETAPEKPTENGDAAATGNSEVQQGKMVGIIYPPPSMRKIIDKTAGFVARNGRDFEKKISQSDDAQMKFAFLQKGNPFNAYYEHKIQEVRSGTTEGKKENEEEKKQKEEEKAKEAAAADTTPEAVEESTKGVAALTVSKSSTVSKSAVVTAPIAKAAQNVPKQAPDPEVFVLDHPTLSAMDMEIIKMTAQYTAVSGRQFLAGVSQREQNNPQFDFLKPTHALFRYFKSLVDSYTSILHPPKNQKARLSEAISKHKADGRKGTKVLERCVHKYEYQRAEDERKREKEEREEQNRIAYQSIDWHDFVVVETIDFNDDDFIDHEENERVKEKMAREADKKRGALPDSVQKYKQEGKPAEPSKPAEPAVKPPEPPAEPLAPPEPPPLPSEDDGEMRIVQNYTPQVQAMAKPQMKGNAIDHTGREVALQDVEEHMRIELLDPRWRDENAKRMAKMKETAFAKPEDISRNLKGFAEKRADIFGSTAEEELKIMQQRNEDKHLQEEAKRIIWDGHQASRATVQQQALEAKQQTDMEKRTKAVAEAAMQSRLPGTVPPPRPAPPSQTLGGAQPPAGMPPRGLPPPGMPPQGMPPQMAGMPPGMMMRPGMPPQMMPPRPGMPGMPPQMGMPGMPPQMARMPGMPGVPPQGMPPTQDTTGLIRLGEKPPAGQEPAQKKPRTDVPNMAPPVQTTTGGLIPEAQFMQANQGPITITIKLPTDGTNAAWNLNGQTISISLSEGVATTCKALKTLASSSHLGNIPLGKFQLKAKAGFLKDSQTLAAVNIGQNSTLELSVKKRGGKR